MNDKSNENGLEVHKFGLNDFSLFNLNLPKADLEGINDKLMENDWKELAGLPSDVKNSDSLDIFKRNLEMFKSKTRALGISGCGNYWEISDEVLNRIEAGNYLENKMRHNEYLKDNPLAARKKFINLN